MDLYSYFQPHSNYFWQWEDDTEVIGIPQASTIAYRDFVVEILEHLSPQGIPPFGSLLLAVVATNPDGQNSLDTIYSIVTHQNKTTDDLMLSKAIGFLKMLSVLPKEYKTGNKRVLLFQTLFKDCHNGISAKDAIEIVQQYKNKGFETVTLGMYASYQYNVCYRDFRVFEMLESRYPDLYSLLDKMADLPRVETEIVLEEPVLNEPSKKDLVEELIQDHKTFQVGSLIKRIWSGLNIPFHNSLPSQQPVGGVSDLTNKGDLSRLLISEYAHEETVFLSRFVNNEALYINREIPPQKNNLERVILIDISIKSWGIPKTLAYALATSIVNHPKTDIHCSVYAVGNSFYPVSVDNVNGIIDGLQLLDAGMNSIEGCKEFFKEFSDRKMEIIFISSSETQGVTEMQNFLNEHAADISYYIKTDQEGNIELFKKQQKSKKFIQHIQLPLEEIWQKQPKRSLMPSDSKIPSYPILFSALQNAKIVIPVNGEEVYMITTRKNLLRQQSPEIINNKGWEMVCEDLPGNAEQYEIGKLENGEHVLLMFNRQSGLITFLNIDTGVQKIHHFAEWRSSGYNRFMFYKNAFYYLYLGFPSRYWVFEWGEEILGSSYENIPKEITDAYQQRVTEVNGFSLNAKHGNGIFKNINQVFINDDSNLIFNRHELILQQKLIFKIKQTIHTKPVIKALQTTQDEFTFPNGSTVTIHRSGMLILRNNGNEARYRDHLSSSKVNIYSSVPYSHRPQEAKPSYKKPWETDEAIRAKNPNILQDASFTIYIPSLINASLGLATETDFSGNTYYLREDFLVKDVTEPVVFMNKYVREFINNIYKYGT